MNQQALSPHHSDSSDNVIDLTSDTESAAAETPEIMAMEGQDISRQGDNRTVVPTRTPEVIDLLEDDDDDREEEGGGGNGNSNSSVSRAIPIQSPEVEFVEERPRLDRPTGLPSSTSSPRFRGLASPNSWLGAGFARYTGLMNQNYTGQMHNYTQSILGRNTTNDHHHQQQQQQQQQQQGIYGFLNHMTPAIEPSTHGTDWLRVHGAMEDFTQVGFDLQTPPRDGAKLAGSRYEAPRPANMGFTRTPKQDDTIVCPSCDVELGVSEDAIQKQIWVIRQCGHTYCGTCANGKIGKKRIMSKCVCDGCVSIIRSGKSCMFMLYI